MNEKPKSELPAKGKPADSGEKYVRTIRSRDGSMIDPEIKVDVYNVIEAFGVTCPARQHAIKKLLCAGLRNKGDTLRDLKECVDAVRRAVELEIQRSGFDEEDSAEEGSR